VQNHKQRLNAIAHHRDERTGERLRVLIRLIASAKNPGRFAVGVLFGRFGFSAVRQVTLRLNGSWRRVDQRTWDKTLAFNALTLEL
jgi:hypothetical protein